MEKSSNIEYFTPDIEDIRVGYEYEYFTGTEWIKGKVFDLYTDRYGYGLGELQDYLNEKKLRVSYLTKEQIEAEGWECYGSLIVSGDSIFKDKNYSYTILYNFNKRVLYLMNRGSEGYSTPGLECKDINTFRYICKLLNI